MTTKLLNLSTLALDEPRPSSTGFLMMAVALAGLLALAVLAAVLAAGDSGLQLGFLRALLPGDPRAWSALTA